MIVCPVCEHAQPQGAECEVCGRRFAAAVVAPPLAPLEGLETNQLPAGAAPEPAAFLELEPTLHGAVPLLAGAAVPDVERTAAAPVDVDAPPIPDLERTQAGLPGDGPTPVAAQVICRYCRTPAAPEQRLCDRCGMRLPVISSSPQGPVTSAARLCSCGTPVSGALCPACGARVSS